MLIQHDRLRDLVRAMLTASGSAEAEAAIVADHLVEANLKGHDSHGVGMMPQYVEHLHKGLLHPNRHAEVVKDDGAFLIVDGGLGHGQVIAREAMALALPKVKAGGVAIVGTRNCHHMGRIGTYGELVAEAGFISIHFVNVTGHPPLVAPFRGSDGRYTTNPICIALPATAATPMVVHDFATSRVALGKVRVAHNKGVKMPPGHLIDPEGRPTDDPGVMFREPKGAALAFGEHKGYGLALLAEILAGAVTGGGTIQPGRPRVGTIINNMLSIIVDPTRMVDLGYLTQEIDAMVAYAKASPPADPAAPVLAPGDPERIARAQRLRDGIDIDPTTWTQMQAAAESLGLDRWAA